MSGPKQVRALIGMIGKAGSGKSTLLRRIASRSRRMIVTDFEGVWAPQPGDEVVEGHKALIARLKALHATDRRRGFRLIYRDRSKELMQDVAPRLALAIWDMTLVIDELAWCSRPNFLPPDLERCVMFGRRYGINLLFTTRRPQEVHNAVLDQATALHFFRVEPGLGLDRVKKHYPVQAAQLAHLPERPPPLKWVLWGDPLSERLIGREGG